MTRSYGLSHALYKRVSSTRREWTANPADPTMVTQWCIPPRRVASRHWLTKWPRISLTLTGSWGVESTIQLWVLGRCWTWHTYDNRVFVTLWSWLEDHWGYETYEKEYDRETYKEEKDYEGDYRGRYYE